LSTPDQATSIPPGSPIELAAQLKGFHPDAAPARVRLESFDRAGRVRRAAIGLAQSWGIAIVSIFIPVAHFFLVPGFFIAGVVIAVRRLGMETIVRGARGTCPDCGMEQTLDLPTRWDPPLDVDCRHCHRRLQLTLSPP
jgi:hypothetical protein